MTLPPFDADIRPPVLPVSDVSYAVDDFAVGRLLLAVTSTGRLVLCRYAASAADEDAWLSRVAASVSPRVLRQARPLDGVRREIEDYLAGRRTRFEVEPDLSVASAFQREVLNGLGHTAFGSRTTYGALAQDIGRPRAARAVGTALGANPVCLVVPCHRVLPGAGGIGGYAGGPQAKEYLLALEGSR